MKKIFFLFTIIFTVFVNLNSDPIGLAEKLDLKFQKLLDDEKLENLTSEEELKTELEKKIEKALQEIGSLKLEIKQNEILFENKIDELKKTNPLFAEDDPFESDNDYLERISKKIPQLNNIRKQYIGDLLQKMEVLRDQLFETQNITVSLDPEQYNPNTEEWKVIVDHLDYEKEHYEVTLKIAKTNASNLFKNKDKLQKTGILVIDFGDKIGLAKLRLSDPISGFEKEFEINPRKKWNNMAHRVTFSNNEKYIAIAGSKLVDGTWGFEIYNFETGDRVKSHKTNCWVGPLAFSPDDKYLAIGGSWTSYYNLETGIRENYLAEHPTVPGKFYRIENSSSLSFSPYGKFIAIATNYYIVKIVKTKTLKTVKTICSGEDKYNAPPIICCTFSPNGKFLAATGGNYGYVGIYNLVSNSIFKTFKHPNLDGDYLVVNVVTYSPDGKFLATGSKYACIFNIETGNKVKTFTNEYAEYFDYEVNTIAYSPDGKLLATGDTKGKVNIYIIATGEKIRTYKPGGNVKTVVFSPDGKYLATANTISTNIYRIMFKY